MMILRKILLSSVKPSYHNTPLNIVRIALQSKQMNYSLYLPYKHHVSASHNYQFVSKNVFNYIFCGLDWKYSHTNTKKEVQCLCDLVLSEDWEEERIQELKKILSFLLSEGYSSKEIKKDFLAHLKSSDCSYAKFKILADIDHDIALLLPLLSLPLSSLQLAAKNSKTDNFNTKDFSSRIHYLSYHLELEPSQLVLALTKHSSLLTMKFNRLHTKMNILKDANISPKYIVKDLWIFNYNELLLADRIQAALKAGIELKPWMLRCSKKFFDSILIKYSETQRILGDDTLHGYLAKKLDCRIEYIDHMMEKNKMLKTINIPKLDQMINFLYAKGYTADEIRLFPRVFCSSVHTLEERFEEFKHVKSTLPTLAQLCMSNKRVLASLDSKRKIDSC